MSKRILIGVSAVAVGTVAALSIGRARETSRARQVETTLLEGASGSHSALVDFATLDALPTPVARYFRHVLTDGQPLVRAARIQQSGVLRTSTETDQWTSFTAAQLIVPPATGFVWNARVETPLRTHVRVLDSYVRGVGAGGVSLLSVVRVGSVSGTPEMNSGALHRYLAEAVWCPTALLPEAGVEWRAIDDSSALATLADRGTTVSLEFRFNELGEVTTVYSAGRFGSFAGEYRQVPWEGHFRNYQVRDGMHVPTYGEVGWYAADTLRLVWKGQISNAQYELTR